MYSIVDRARGKVDVPVLSASVRTCPMQRASTQLTVHEPFIPIRQYSWTLGQLGVVLPALACTTSPGFASSPGAAGVIRLLAGQKLSTQSISLGSASHQPPSERGVAAAQASPDEARRPDLLGQLGPANLERDDIVYAADGDLEVGFVHGRARGGGGAVARCGRVGRAGHGNVVCPSRERPLFALLGGDVWTWGCQSLPSSPARSPNAPITGTTTSGPTSRATSCTVNPGGGSLPPMLSNPPSSGVTTNGSRSGP